ncbi:flagellar basal body rod protein FlgB [Endozoicomonas lisbonensis]|uniref:Flagellar basal body rod protein FlgB n=1 Tax=Endozoicomonas lisbonensis TaxID=3120522 RepID=A0ABV2SBJ7_9GAMM
MAISFENALGVLPGTLQYRTQRAEVLASNIANVDTPGYRAKDLSFDHILGQQQAQLRLQQSDSRHIALPGTELEESVVERDVRQPSSDGNSVELGVEQAAFMRNNMEFQTSFTFLNMKMKGLQRAINGQ